VRTQTHARSVLLSFCRRWSRKPQSVFQLLDLGDDRAGSWNHLCTQQFHSLGNPRANKRKFTHAHTHVCTYVDAFLQDFRAITLGVVGMFNIFISFPFFVVLCGLFSWQLWLLKENCTTIEHRAYEHLKLQWKRQNNRKSRFQWPYSYGWRRNFSAALGENVLDWFLPTPLQEDGVYWKAH
jgi:hypothetical protein